MIIVELCLSVNIVGWLHNYEYTINHLFVQFKLVNCVVWKLHLSNTKKGQCEEIVQIRHLCLDKLNFRSFLPFNLVCYFNF